jgi:hypothetical protein
MSHPASIIENAALGWFAELGYAVGHGRAKLGHAGGDAGNASAIPKRSN